MIPTPRAGLTIGSGAATMDPFGFPRFHRCFFSSFLLVASPDALSPVTVDGDVGAVSFDSCAVDAEAGPACDPVPSAESCARHGTRSPAIKQHSIRIHAESFLRALTKFTVASARARC